MVVRIELLSDGIFGSGRSVPGLEDISVIHDEYGFPYLSGTNFKGNLRESVSNIAVWSGMGENIVEKLFGKADKKGLSGDISGQITVSDFLLPAEARKAVIEELGIKTAEDCERYKEYVLDIFSELRTFTALEDDTAKAGSLRMARCINEGLVFYGSIEGVEAEDEKVVKEALGQIKWLGTMRTRGFGQVRITSGEEIR